MGRSNKNTNSKYIYNDRYQRFVKNLCDFAIKARSNKEIDMSPDKVLSGNFGDVLTKDNNYIYYNSALDGEVVSLSDQFQDITNRTAGILSSGINKKVTWVKTNLNDFSWKFLGYYTFIVDRNCCSVNPTKRKRKDDVSPGLYPIIIPDSCSGDSSDKEDECCHDYYMRLTYSQAVTHQSGRNGIIHIILSEPNQRFDLSSASNAVLGDYITVIVDVAHGVTGVYGCTFYGLSVGTGTSLKLVCAGTENEKYWKTILTSETII